jgi:hypothetical protein
LSSTTHDGDIAGDAAGRQRLAQFGFDPRAADGLAGARHDRGIERRGGPPGDPIAIGQRGEPAGIQLDPFARGGSAGDRGLGQRAQSLEQVAQTQDGTLDDHGGLEPHRPLGAHLAGARLAGAHLAGGRRGGEGQDQDERQDRVSHGGSSKAR